MQSEMRGRAATMPEVLPTLDSARAVSPRASNARPLSDGFLQSTPALHRALGIDIFADHMV